LPVFKHDGGGGLDVELEQAEELFERIVRGGVPIATEKKTTIFTGTGVQ